MKRSVRELGIGVSPKPASISPSDHAGFPNGFPNGSLTNGLQDAGGMVNGINGINAPHTPLPMDLSDPISNPLSIQGRLDDITDEDIEEGTGGVEDVASEGVVLSNGVPIADELVAELDIDGEMVATENGVGDGDRGVGVDMGEEVGGREGGSVD